MTNIGVLALQGAFSKHMAMLESIGAHAIDVRKPEDLASCQGLIIPGGESTTIMRQLNFINFSDALKEFSKKKPLFGTCAGLILMSKEIIGDPMEPLDVIDVLVERNAFGRQYESFSVNLSTKLGAVKPELIPAVFIRAPRIRHCGPEIEVLAAYEGEPVLVKQGFHLGATFHPELTHCTAIHAYFLSLVENQQKKLF
jgi:pyridoxal 5'-phosphate synthase pdxT subunit